MGPRSTEASWRGVGRAGALLVLSAVLALPAPGARADMAEDARAALRVHDFARAARLWRTLAERGDPQAQYELGVLYRSGLGVAVDPREAVHWIRAAAEQGHPRAELVLGTLYDSGWGVARDRGAALAWLRKSAAQGNEAARRRLEDLERERHPSQSGSAASPNARKGAAGSAADTGRRPAPDPAERSPRPRARPDTTDLVPVDPAAAAAELAKAYPGWSALEAAAWRGQGDLVRRLVASGASPDLADAEGHTALSRAAWRGDAEIVGLLLAADAKVDTRSADGRTALHWASEAGCGPCAEALLDQGASTDPRDARGRTPLGLAARQGDGDVVRVLLARRADPTVADAEGVSPLERAILSRHAEVSERMLQAVPPSALPAGAWTRLLCATIDAGMSSLVGLELDRGASARAACPDASPALVHAATRGDVASATALLDRGADPGARTASGNDALMLAADRGQAGMVELLLRRGADPNGRGSRRYTPLFFAAGAGHLPVVELLLSNGARPNLRSADGITAAELALRAKHPEVAARLDRETGKAGGLLGAF